MSTLAEWLELGEKVQAARKALLEEEQRLADAEREQKLAALVARAKLAGRELLGRAFDELVVGEPVPGYDLEKVSFLMALGPGPKVFRFEFDSRDGRVTLWFGSHASDSLKMPVDPERLALFIVNQRAAYLAAREKAIARAIKELEQPELDEYDGDPQRIFERNVDEWPDVAEVLRPVLQATLERAKVAMENAKRMAAEHEGLRTEVQGRMWVPFTVWRLTYADLWEDGGGAHFVAYSLAPEADAAGWWPCVRDGVQTLTSFPHLLKIEEVPVLDWTSDLCLHVCRKMEINGVKVVVPPADCMRIIPAEAL